MEINGWEYCQTARERPRKDKYTGGCCYTAIKPPALSTRAIFALVRTQENRLNAANVVQHPKGARKKHQIHNWVHSESSRGETAKQ